MWISESSLQEGENTRGVTFKMPFLLETENYFPSCLCSGGRVKPEGERVLPSGKVWADAVIVI